jgi:RND family efflux transporter MFP subunit
LSIEPRPEPSSSLDGTGTQAPPVADAGALRAYARRNLRWLLPLVALAVGGLISLLLFATRPTPATREPPVPVPIVRVMTVVPQTLQLSVEAHGTVTPRTQSDLVAEVRGRVIWVSPSLVAGGFFAQGDELLRLDGREHEIEVDRARAAVALKGSERKLASAEAARRRQLASSGAASAADLEQFESRELVSRASLDEARAALAQAQLDLERTVVRAPFDGRVRERPVDVGQFVNPGAKLARIYAIDYAEVRLPIQTDDLSHLGLPLDGSLPADVGELPVLLSARMSGRELQWPARLIRSEGEIDLRTRMLHVVARVEDPYARGGSGLSPLPAGLFVKARIEGRTLENVSVIPLAALRDGANVYVLDSQDRLQVRPVALVRRTREHAIVLDGLAAGERLVISPLRAVTDGMQVRPLAEEAP